MPHNLEFVNLRANIDMTNLIVEINDLLPQFSNFISQFNTLVIQSGINVLTDSMGNMSIDIPNDMPDAEATRVNTRIGIIDRLIKTRAQEINSLLQKGLELEKDIKIQNPEYKSELMEKVAEFKRLSASYKH